MRVVVQEFLTLDGVMQAPGGSDEDLEDGFEHGGWQMNFPGGEEDDDNSITEWESKTEALLLGRKTYQIWEGAWGVWPEDAPGFMGEFTRRYNRVPKYVASRTRTQESLTWKNSHLLGDDLRAEVAALRKQPGGEIRVWGSSVLIRSLAEHDLVDEYRLVIYPIILGTGKKLFPDGFPAARFTLAEHRALPSGVVINIYQRR